jgi:hypothetical protein
LASNFNSFFEKLTEILEQLSEKLPHYNELVLLAPRDISVNFRHSITRLYCDLFEFFKATARVFTQKDGSKAINPCGI